MGSRKKLISTILPTMLCVMALLLAACGGSTPPASTTKAAQSKQVFINPDTNPHSERQFSNEVRCKIAHM